MKKLPRPAVALLGAGGLLLSGCEQREEGSDTVAEGVIYSVEYNLPGGGTGGFTRLNNSKAVPGGNGSWSVEAYGRLTPEHLIITQPQRKDLGPRVIPASRLIEIQFGDGGIKDVAPPTAGH